MERRAGGINSLADFISFRLRLISPVVRLFPARSREHVHAFLTCAVRFNLSLSLTPCYRNSHKGALSVFQVAQKIGSRTDSSRTANMNHSSGGLGPIHGIMHSVTLSTNLRERPLSGHIIFSAVLVLTYSYFGNKFS